MADLVPNPQEAKLRGGELKGARDALQDKILTQTTWCIYCCYGGCGIDGMDLPCCFTTGEICCCGGTTKITSCYDQDGCVAVSSKMCCCLTGFECPPDNNPGIGIGPARCMGNLEGRTPDDCTSVAAKNELDMYQKTMWCWSCYCCFQGITYDMSPICQNEGKLCCLWVNTETASCCDDGWIEFSGKCCCTVLDCSIPAGYTPGVVCCGVTLCCANMPEQQAMD
mmetsp:Transcript_48012/g.96842  ORF Transcript_48012/g.96842 Transcript_48012/m.96842 type:complete len:224 (+) Transcript_48012:96-767(+)